MMQAAALINCDLGHQTKAATWAASACVREKHERPKGFVEQIVPVYSLRDFQSHFRLERGTVSVLMTELHRNGVTEAVFVGGNTPISFHKMTLVTLWYLANQESMRGIADRFDIAKSSVHHIIRQITHTLANGVARKFVKWPTLEAMSQIAADFKARANFPGVIGAIDGSHIPIAAPADHQDEYNNRKMTHSIVLQAVCDNTKKFTNCFAGFPGSAHDARVLYNSELYKQTEQSKTAFFPRDSYHLVGDSAYPLNSWLVVPFKDVGLSEQQTRYNSKLSQTRVVIECAFGLLKCRFRRLNMVVAKIESIPDIVVGCCVLHNMCLDNRDYIDDMLDIEGMTCVSSTSRNCTTETDQGKVKRDFIVSTLSVKYKE